jgi:DNA polymerase III alpha subunit (gram-positive type)
MSKLYIPLDTETGGLDPKTSDVLTIYIAVADENFKILDELDLKLKPDDRLPITEAGAMKVNGIDLQKHLADPTTVTYSEAKTQISAMLKKHLKKNGRYSNLIPMGHNIPFDLGMIHHHIMDKKSWEEYCHYRNVDTNPIVWLMKDSGWWPFDLGSLVSVVDFLGIPKRNAHSAKDDTLMTIDVYKKMLEIMKSKKDGGGGTQDLISLLEAE